MAIPTDPSLLAQAAACEKCIPVGSQMEVMIYLLQQIAGNTMTTDQLLAASACMRCIPVGSQPEVIVYLLTQIATAAGA